MSETEKRRERDNVSTSGRRSSWPLTAFDLDCGRYGVSYHGCAYAIYLIKVCFCYVSMYAREKQFELELGFIISHHHATTKRS